jgi:hypothetical protein
VTLKLTTGEGGMVASTSEHHRDDQDRVGRKRGFAIGVAAFAVLLAGSVFGTVLARSSQPARASTGNSCRATSSSAPILGSWHVQVHFDGPPMAGVTENAIETFTPGGGVVEADSTDSTAVSSEVTSGSWRQNSDCTYTMRLVHLFNDAATHGVARVVMPTVRYVLDSAQRLHSIAARTRVYVYEPHSGRIQGRPIVLGSSSAPVSVSTGERFTTDWTPPAAFRPEP